MPVPQFCGHLMRGGQAGAVLRHGVGDDLAGGQRHTRPGRLIAGPLRVHRHDRGVPQQKERREHGEDGQKVPHRRTPLASLFHKYANRNASGKDRFLRILRTVKGIGGSLTPRYRLASR
jgi:hypothetical protein